MADLETESKVTEAELTPQSAETSATVSTPEVVVSSDVNTSEASTAPEAPAEAAAATEEPKVITSSDPAPEADKPDATVPPVAPVAAKKPASQGGSKLHLVIEAILVLLLIVVGYFAYSLNQDKKDLQAEVTKLNSNPSIVAQKQSDATLTAVGKLIQLPKGETPTIADVTDVNKARQQSPFFNSAQNGDKVLLYVKAGQAILYRPSTGKIVIQAPLTFTNNATGTKQ